MEDHVDILCLHCLEGVVSGILVGNSVIILLVESDPSGRDLAALCLTPTIGRGSSFFVNCQK